MYQFAELVPLIIYTVVAVLVIGVLLFAAWWLGAKTTSRNKEMPYESGVIPSGAARRPLSVPFYLIAIYFIVFDVETAFIFTWAADWDRLGMPGLLHITFFIGALLLGLAWLWVKGGLEWGPSAGKRVCHRDTEAQRKT
ncbi:MAG: NADH-quinone oxidoreductase subunit A [Geobacteraceae bacterium GWC2_53_11]|nr:MAG: NADH-quinone oxidoreductase subunit A [Geobacteraceae bacterium GWC2_53_11]